MAIINQDGVDGKRCIHCHEWKPLQDFSPRRLYGQPKGDGYQSYCKVCYRHRFRRWREANLERQRVYEQNYRKANREKLRAYDRAHYLAHRDRHNELIRLAYRKNPQKKLKRIREYFKANPGKAAAKSNRRRAREHAAPGSHTVAEWNTLKEYYQYTCLCCKKSEPTIELTRDHIVALDVGGSDSIDNIQPLCRSCNAAKGNRTIDYRPPSDRKEIKEVLVPYNFWISPTSYTSPAPRRLRR